ncbi:MAG: hypothetical protein M3406_08945 [Chloroflexota bacterium]|nr:hypothetical protein [Chloroflexota bacterium]
MDISKLGQNEKLAMFGSAAVILAGLISNWGGLLFLSILAAIGMLVVVFLPQFSTGTSLPGSKGSLMAALGILAAAGAVITALRWLGSLGLIGSLNTIMFFVAVIGALVMAYAGWQELQSEGGKWVFGGTGAHSPASTPSSDSAHRDSAPVDHGAPEDHPRP